VFPPTSINCRPNSDTDCLRNENAWGGALSWASYARLAQDEKPEHAGSEAGDKRRLIKGALAMKKVAVYIAFVLSTAWLLFGSWQLPQTVSGNHASRERTNDYWQDASRAPMTDEGETEATVARAEGEQLSIEE
jgi:hypothetical protein